MVQFALSIVLFLGTQQGQLVVIDATTQEVTDHVYHAIGNVVVTYEDMRIEADEATHDRDTNIVTAGNHIKYTRGGEHLEADHITVNIETKTGDFTNVKGEVGPGFFITAEEAHRTADGRYELKNATVTTCCDAPQRGWTLALARATVDPHKRVTARGSLFRLEKIPMLYLPYVTVPSSDRDRSTGFLIPSTSTSTTKGRSLRESFYWAINRSADATFSGEYFTKRGPAGAIDFRARPDENAYIRVDSFFAKDRKGQGGRSARILAYGDVARGFRAVADMNLVNSFVFRQVYEDGLNIISSPLEHSLAFTSRNRPYSSMNFLFARSGVFFTDERTVALRKFPAIEMSLPLRPLGKLPVYFSADAGFAGIARRDAAITTPSFVERLDLRPALEATVVNSSVITWSQRVSIRETAYTHSRLTQSVIGDSLNRFSLDYSSHIVGPQIQRDFGSWRHVIEPAVDYRYLNGADRFRRTLVIDDVDLITNTNEVEYAITNRFFTTREVFSWRLAQKYFFDPTFGGAIVQSRRNVFAPLLDISGFAFADGARRVSPIVSTMRVSTSASTSTDLEVDYDTRSHLFRSAGIIGNASRGQLNGGISYFFTRRSVIEIPNNQLRGTVSYGNALKPGFSGAFQFSYDVQHSLFQGSVAQVGYNTNCYGLNFEVSQFNIGAHVESRFRFAFVLRNIGSVGTIRPAERLF